MRFPDERFEGKVLLVHPELDMATRTAMVQDRVAQSRRTAQAPSLRRSRNRYRRQGRDVIAVPQSAIIDSGERQVVIVEREDGLYEPRDVKLGRSSGGLYGDRFRTGAGEQIVTAGNFLIDSESNLRASLNGLNSGGDAAMIAAIIRWSARNVMLVLIGAAFATLAGLYSLSRIPLDAIPDLSDTQVIVYTDYPGQAPQVIEDQVTFPLTTAMLSVPRSRVVRGFSFFGVSFVYVIFEDGTDIYWARSRVLEYLNVAAQKLPEGVTPNLGPDASGVGWVYQYALTGKGDDLSQQRSQQDWHVRFAAAKAEGVAEVASVGGYVKQYAVVIDPLRLKALGITLDDVREAIRASNMDVGGRTVELSETEFMVRGRGYLPGIEDIENIGLKASDGTPVRMTDIARVELVPDERRGVTELNGEGEVASGIAVQRYGANALDVIRNVKQQLAEIAPSLPEGMEIVSVYDRSALIYRAIENLGRTLAEESAVVAFICVIFLLHVRSAFVAIVTLPIGILIAMAVMQWLGIGSNIMSLGGIAIAIGAMVDAAIVMVENAHKRLERMAAGRVARRGDHQGGRRSRPGAVLQPAGDHRVVPADLCARSAGRPAVQAARLYQVLLHGGGGAAVDHAGAGADDPVHPRPHRARSAQPPQPPADLALPAGHPARAAGQDADHRWLAIAILAASCDSGDAARHRVHAQSQRRHAVLYAGDLAGHFGDQGGGTPADPEQDHQIVPGGRKRLGQSRPRADGDRSGASRDGRDRHQPEAGGPMAARPDRRLP